MPAPVLPQEPEGLTPGPQTAQLSQRPEYDELVALDPGFGPVAANEEPDKAETAHFEMMYADFVEALYGSQSKNAEEMLKTSQNLYTGVAKVAFNILNAVHQRHEQRDGPVPQAALFGEGAMINTAVDEVFSMAMSLKIPEAQDQDQYTAAQMDMMRLVGEFLEKSQSDESINEAQELMLDMETADGLDKPVDPLNAEEQGDLKVIAETGTVLPQNSNSAFARAGVQSAKDNQAGGGGLQPENVPPPQPPPQQGGLV
jgi:hypothetical protein